jgi:PIN domain
MHILILDSNSYRELGVSFHNNIDFKYLLKFLHQGPHELILLDIVYKELVDYFNNDYVGKLISDYQNLILRFEKSEYVDNIDIPELTEIENKAISLFKANLDRTCWRKVDSNKIDIDSLIDFSLFNKRESKKDNTRDFIIWSNLISLSYQYYEDNIIFISRDKIFKENSFFQNLLITHKRKNITVVESVSTYLSDYGLRIDFLNNQKVLDSIDVKLIEKELRNDIDCFPSYVSNYYYDGSNRPPKNVSLEILDITLYEYYTYSEDKTKVIIVSSYLVGIKAIYDIEKRVNLKDFEKEFYYDEIKHRVDNENRVIYENNVLFIFEGEVDMKNKKVINHEFADFIPDWNIKKSNA